MKLLPEFRDIRFENWAQMKAQEAHFARLRAALPIVEWYEPIPRDVEQMRAERRLEAKYSADQPRVPRGNPRGGQWTREDGGAGDATEEDDTSEESEDDSTDEEDSGFYESDWDYSPSSNRDNPDRRFGESHDIETSRSEREALPGADPPSYGEAPDGTPVEGAQYTPGHNGRPRADLYDPTGNPVMNLKNEIVQYATSHPPEYFAQRGEEVRDIQTAMRLEQPGAGVAQIIQDLYQFRQGGPWDLQRQNMIFDRDLIDYSTIVIGIYAAAAGISENDLLSLQNQYAYYNSKFGKDEKMDDVYKYLARRNVWNTLAGYDLYRRFYRKK